MSAPQKNCQMPTQISATWRKHEEGKESDSRDCMISILLDANLVFYFYFHQVISFFLQNHNIILAASKPTLIDPIHHIQFQSALIRSVINFIMYTISITANLYMKWISKIGNLTTQETHFPWNAYPDLHLEALYELFPASLPQSLAPPRESPPPSAVRHWAKTSARDGGNHQCLGWLHRTSSKAMTGKVRSRSTFIILDQQYELVVFQISKHEWIEISSRPLKKIVHLLS